MKKRLMELISNIETSADDPRTFEDIIATELIAHGVILPPCKVGDTVYMPWKWHGVKAVAHLQVMSIVVKNTIAYVRADFITDDEGYFEAYGRGEFEFTDFGKTVFLTREEAEKALGRRE